MEASVAWGATFFDGAGAPRGGNSSSDMIVGAGAPVVRGFEAPGRLPVATGTLGSCCAIIGMLARGIPGCTMGGIGGWGMYP